MNNSVLFYADEANFLNHTIQHELAAHLFLFCNYTPTPLRVFSTDAKYVVAINNLYKLLIDSSIVNLVHKLCKETGICIRKKELREVLDLASILRTVVAHNVSESNGTEEQIIWYKRWLLNVCGKNEIECEKDYEVALQELEKRANKAMQILKLFIDEAKKLDETKKEKLIAIWEKYLIDFYCKDSNKNIFIGQLKNAYLSTQPMSMRENFNPRDVAIWIRDKIYYAEEKENETLSEILESGNGILKESVLSEIRRKIASNQEKMNSRKEELMEACHCTEQELRRNVFLFQKHYCKKVEGKLYDALEVIRKENLDREIPYTMLPHDIMQIIIQRDFQIGKS